MRATKEVKQENEAREIRQPKKKQTKQQIDMLTHILKEEVPVPTERTWGLVSLQTQDGFKEGKTLTKILSLGDLTGNMGDWASKYLSQWEGKKWEQLRTQLFVL